MFKSFRKKSAQNTVEYALLISLVVAAVVSMQVYTERTIQARVRDASQQFVDRTWQLGSSTQVEPYYLASDYDTLRDETTEQVQGVNTFNTFEDSQRTRAEGGFQASRYCDGTDEDRGYPCVELMGGP
jgi:Na+-transporting NADH:ubiquinone oxidoreductase subunit NqrC